MRNLEMRGLGRRGLGDRYLSGPVVFFSVHVLFVYVC